MVSQPSKVTIEVDPQAADILKRVSELADNRGQTLGSYLQDRLLIPSESAEATVERQRAAFEKFIATTRAWTAKNLPPGYTADDSRDSVYD